jgi:pimeloyl-ACP methyl ester carboxylesterase/DNA-binding CsgD family transcriptional regulator
MMETKGHRSNSTARDAVDPLGASEGDSPDFAPVSASSPTLPTHSADAPDTEALQSQVLDRLYDIALDPGRLDGLLDHWEELIAPHRHDAGSFGPVNVGGENFLAHFKRLSDILDRTSAKIGDPRDAVLAEFRKSAAFVIDESMTITRVNDAARQGLHLTPGQPLTQVGIQDEDLHALVREVGHLFRLTKAANDPAPRSSQGDRLIRARGMMDDRLILIQPRLIQPDHGPPFVLAVTSELHWPDSADQVLRDSFGLTQAETEVLRALTASRNLRDVAQQRGRSVETIRAQIKSLQSKTESNGQSDLMRMALSVMEIAPLVVEPDQPPDPHSDAMPSPRRISRGGEFLRPRPFERFTAPDGRRVEYLQFGARSGQPVVYMCGTFGLCRWPVLAEQMAAERGLRIIVPIRPGYGGTCPLPKRADRLQGILADTAALLDHLNIPAATFLTTDEDLIFATNFQSYAPGRVSGIVACAGQLPLTRPEQYERMGRWHRFILAGARYTPRLVPFMVKTGAVMVRKIGKKEFLRQVYATSEPDRALTRAMEVFEALEIGSEIVFAPDLDATSAFAAEVVITQGTDWLTELRACEGQVDIVVLNGRHDPAVPPATVQDFHQDFPWIRFEYLEDAGQLLLFSHYDLVLDHVADLAIGNQGFSKGDLARAAK